MIFGREYLHKSKKTTFLQFKIAGLYYDFRGHWSLDFLASLTYGWLF